MLALQLKVTVETRELARLRGRPDPRAQEPALRAKIVKLAKEAALAVRHPHPPPCLITGQLLWSCDSRTALLQPLTHGATLIV